MDPNQCHIHDNEFQNESSVESLGLEVVAIQDVALAAEAAVAIPAVAAARVVAAEAEPAVAAVAAMAVEEAVVVAVGPVQVVAGLVLGWTPMVCEQGLLVLEVQPFVLLRVRK